ncbi:MAG: hypothetical protein NTV21_01255 [Planctomycetota bacterium]|nr:hypothetical protein [Planctomycetota bacterium]
MNESRSKALVWGTWLAATLAALALVWSCGPRFPYQDDFALTTRLTGTQPFTWHWLWSGYNDHRFPLSMLVLLGVHGASGADHRVALVLEVLMLAGLAALALRTLRSVRGRTSPWDAALPLACLHWGHWINILLAFQLWLVLSVAITGAFVASFAARRGELTLRAALLGSLGLASLPLLGGSGALSAPPLALAALALAFAARSRVAARATLACGSLVALALFVAYVSGFERTFNEQNDDRVSAQLLSFLRFSSLGAGPSYEAAWPVAAALSLALAAGCAALNLRALRDRDSRPRAIALLGGLAVLTSLGLGIAWGRSAPGYEVGLEDRYVTLLLPLVLVVSLTTEIWLAERWRQPARVLLFVVAAAGAVNGYRKGLEGALDVRHHAQEVERAVASGASSREIAEQMTPWMFPDAKELARLLADLRRAGLPPFDRGAPGPEVDRKLPKFGSFSRQPDSGEPSQRIVARELDGREVAALNDPGELRFELDGNQRGLHVLCGFLEEARGRGDGLVFAVEWRPKSGAAPSVLFERELAPPRDGELPMLTVELDLPQEAGTLALVTRNATGRHARWDRAWWGELVLR